MKVLLSGLLAALLAVSSAIATEPATDAQATAEKFVASLNFHNGDIAIPKADAHFRLGSEFRYLEQADARRVLEQLWGNPPDESVLGMVVPANKSLLDEHSWAVVVTYSDDGYVSDEDASKIDYDEMLVEMKSGTRDGNEARKKAGYQAIELIGWATPPRYDATSKKLYWAKELAFEGSEQHTLNYDIRVLGRRGYLSLNAISGMSDVATVQAGMQQLLPMAEFDAGERYADFNKSTDKLAAYGLAALVGGGIAAKTGLFAKLGVMLLALKKLLIPLLLLVAAFGKKIFGKLFGDKEADRSKTIS